MASSTPIASDKRWRARDIVQTIEPVSPAMTCGDAALLFESRPTTNAFAIVTEDSQPIGLIDRGSFLGQLAHRYGFALYERKPVTALMNLQPMIVEANDELQFISLRITLHQPEALRSGFIICDGGRYVGLGSGLDLMSGVVGELEEALDELKSAQATIIQSEKFAALGQLVAGVAHEINTPIGVGLVAATHFTERASTFKAKIADGQVRKSDLAAFVDGAVEAASMVTSNLVRASELVQSFKQVAVDQTRGDRRRFELRRHLEDLVASLSPSFRKTPHRLVVACPEGLALDSYPGPFAQVISNLAMNSLAHAFSDDKPGTIIVSVTERDARTVVLTVSDDGAGIPEQNLGKIFEPFFTTKRGQGGTGLGLHIVFNIVTQTLGGAIDCASTVGAGTRFTLTLPVLAPEPARETTDGTHA